MRVVMLSDLYPPVIGGMETHVQLLARALAERGHECSVVTLPHPDAAAFEQDGHVDVHRLDGWTTALTPVFKDPRRRFHPPLPDLGFARRLAHINAELRPDIIHAHGWAMYSGLALRRRPGQRFVVTLHDFSLVCARKIYLHGSRPCDGPSYGKCVSCSWSAYDGARGPALATALRASAPLHRRIDSAIAISAAIARVAERTLGEERISIIPSFFDRTAADGAHTRPRAAFLPPEDGYLLFVGALGPHKGLDVLLDAYERLRTDVPLVVIGTPRHDTPIAFPPGVIVATNVPSRDVMTAWAHCSIGIVPSVCPEGFGIVAAEAMALGRPVIASAIGGLTDIVADGDTGLLVPPGDRDALTQAMSTLLADPARCTQLGAAARRCAVDFTASAVAERVEALYARTLGGSFHG